MKKILKYWKNKNRADYVWSKDEELKHYRGVAEKATLKAIKISKELKHKILLGKDTPLDWKNFNEAVKNMEFYLNLMNEKI